MLLLRNRLAMQKSENANLRRLNTDLIEKLKLLRDNESSGSGSSSSYLGNKVSDLTKERENLAKIVKTHERMQYVLLNLLEVHQEAMVQEMKASRPAERLTGSSLRLVQHRNIFNKSSGKQDHRSTNSSNNERLKGEFLAQAERLKNLEARLKYGLAFGD